MSSEIVDHVYELAFWQLSSEDRDFLSSYAGYLQFLFEEEDTLELRKRFLRLHIGLILERSKASNDKG
jgi:hypothetical protein